MNRKLKIFLASAIPFGIVTGILFACRYSIKTGVMGGLSAGLIFGFLMFVILGLLHERAVYRIANTKSRETLGTHHVREIELPLPYDKSFDLCIDSLTMIKRCKIIDVSRTRGSIIARAGINWKTWSDAIAFSLTEIHRGNTRVTVSSRPGARTTLVDFGKNLDNVEKISDFLENAVGAGHRARPDTQ